MSHKGHWELRLPSCNRRNIGIPERAAALSQKGTAALTCSRPTPCDRVASFALLARTGCPDEETGPVHAGVETKDSHPYPIAPPAPLSQRMGGHVTAQQSNTGTVEARLADLGLTLPVVAKPVAAYVPAIQAGKLVWTAGQLPFVGGALPVTGKVGTGSGLVEPERAYELAKICALNALAAIKNVVENLDTILQVVKLVGFVASDPDFTGQAAVINGASDLLSQVLGDAGVHARSTVGVNVLPLNAPVEVELTVVLR